MSRFSHNVVYAIVIISLISTSEVQSIVGGHTTQPGEATYIAAILTSSGSTFVCAGVLVTPTWVLTTSKCVSNKSEADLKVLLGSHRLITNKRSIAINTIVRHPAYSTATGAHDLALLKLSETVSQSLRVAAISLNDQPIVSNNPTIFHGWGSFEYGSTAFSNILQSLYQRTLTTTDCRSLISNLSDGNICAAAQSKQAACSKDEGGPLVQHSSGKLIGIFTYGSQCSGRSPDVFVDVYTHKSWIDTTAV